MNNRETIKKILTYIKNYKMYVIGSFLFASISVILTLYAPILIGEGIDLILEKGLWKNFRNPLFILNHLLYLPFTQNKLFFFANVIR